MGEDKATLGGAVVNASPEIVYNLIAGGISAVQSGDVTFRKPDQPVGVRADNMPDDLRAKLTAIKHQKVIWSYRSWKGPIETANIKLTCDVQYNGPEVQATFFLPADGMRSRLGTNTTIEISNPLPLERRPAPADWQKAGFKLVPVVYLRVSISVDEPAPVANTTATFELMLSGMAGFGATGDGKYIKDYQQSG